MEENEQNPTKETISAASDTKVITLSEENEVGKENVVKAIPISTVQVFLDKFKTMVDETIQTERKVMEEKHN